MPLSLTPGHGNIVFTLIFVAVVVVTTLSINVCRLVVLVFGGYLGGASIVRCCVSRMRVGCSQIQKGSVRGTKVKIIWWLPLGDYVRFLFTWRKNYGLNGLYQVLADKETAVHECRDRESMYISIVWGVCRLPVS